MVDLVVNKTGCYLDLVIVGWILIVTVQFVDFSDEGDALMLLNNCEWFN